MAENQSLTAFPEEPLAEHLDVLAELNNELNNGESRALLDVIDSLRELQVGDLVSLPQIVVVGDKSAGKSSVLEAISGVPFPVEAERCTRFATEVVLRRAERTKLAVSIRYADASGDVRPGVNLFRRTEFLDVESLPDIIDTAMAEMSIGTDHDDLRRFTKNVLRVEIARPNVYPLTLVDLPGIFSNNETTDEYPNAEEDKQIVNPLINSYLQQENSIILAVVSATNQLANKQEAVDWARAYDLRGVRTMGVITKADLVSHDEEEGAAIAQRFVDVVRGVDPAHQFNNGWFVLRNLSEEEKQEEGLKLDERDTLETQFFETDRGWSSVPPAHRGIHSLRKALSKVLLEHIKAGLPGLVREIETELQLRRNELRRMGRPKTSPDELRSYMLGVAKKVSRLVGDGVDGRYADDFFDAGDDDDVYDEGSPRKLRANLRNLNRAFYAVLKEKGAAQTIILPDTETDPVFVFAPVAEKTSGAATPVPDYLQHLVDQYRDFPDPKQITRPDFDHAFEIFAANNQGRQLPGVPNSDLAIDLFRRQAKPWKELARFHLDLVLMFSKSFVEAAFTHVIGGGGGGSYNDSGSEHSHATLAAILNTHVDPFFERKRAVLEAKLDEILRPYTRGNGLPLETEFRDTLYETTLLRLGKRVATILEETEGKETATVSANDSSSGRSKKHPTDIQAKLSIVVNEARHMTPSTDEFRTEQVVDVMMTYYDMSRRTFTENVINLVVENCLVCDLPDVLTATTVCKMSDDRLRELAAESEEVVAKWARLQDEVRILEQGLARCRMHMPRTTIVLPSPPVRLSAPVPETAAAVAAAANPYAAAMTENCAAPKAKIKIKLPRAKVYKAATATVSTSTSGALSGSSPPGGPFQTPVSPPANAEGTPATSFSSLSSFSAASPPPPSSKPSLFGGSAFSQFSQISQSSGDNTAAKSSSFGAGGLFSTLTPPTSFSAPSTPFSTNTTAKSTPKTGLFGSVTCTAGGSFGSFGTPSF